MLCSDGETLSGSDGKGEMLGLTWRVRRVIYRDQSGLCRCTRASSTRVPVDTLSGDCAQ
jgi:hypothetical protein